MPVALSKYLQETIDNELPALRRLSDADAIVSRRNGWTPKQELGHLIDSAANNHARFVLITLQDGYIGTTYDPDAWVALHGYAEMPWQTLVDFWYSYNTFVAKLVSRIPEERLNTSCSIGNGGSVTLQFLIEDYVLHLQHHIDQLLGKDAVTQYPPVVAAP